MPTTYQLQNTNSDLSGGADFNKAINASTATGSASIGIDISETRTSRGFTAAGDPGAGGVTGDYTIEFDCDAVAPSVRLSVQLHRVNSSGVVQQSSSISSEQVCGQVTFNYTALNLGTWASGNRLRVDFIFREIGEDADTTTIYFGRNTGEIIVPWGAASGQPMMGRGRLVPGLRPGRIGW